MLEKIIRTRIWCSDVVLSLLSKVPLYVWSPGESADPEGFQLSRYWPIKVKITPNIKIVFFVGNCSQDIYLSCLKVISLKMV